MAEQLGYNSPDGCIAQGQKVEVIAAGATKTLVEADSGATVLLDTAAGSVVTLPVPVAGMTFDFVVSASVTSNSHDIVTDAATSFIGGGIQQMIDTTAVSEGQFGNPASHVKIAMNGTTTGGLIGTHIKLTAISTTVWDSSGLVASSGTLATPYA